MNGLQRRLPVGDGAGGRMLIVDFFSDRPVVPKMLYLLLDQGLKAGASWKSHWDWADATSTMHIKQANTTRA